MYSFAFFTIYGYITNSQCDQLPAGLIAQLVEHCTGIAEVMGSNPAQAWIFKIQIYVLSYIHLRSISVNEQGNE